MGIHPWLDLSQYNDPLDDSYPSSFVIIRSGDGTWLDEHFPANRAWCEQAVSDGRLFGYGVYHVWRPDGDHGLAALRSRLGEKHHPHVMIEWDIESWGGEIKGDHSRAIKATMVATRRWLSGLRPAAQRRWPLGLWYRLQDRRRVRLYANAGDLAQIAPRATRLAIRLAAYGTNPRRPRHWAHQYSSTGHVGHWSPVDVNDTGSQSARRLARRLGLVVLRVKVAR